MNYFVINKKSKLVIRNICIYAYSLHQSSLKCFLTFFLKFKSYYIKLPERFLLITYNPYLKFVCTLQPIIEEPEIKEFEESALEMLIEFLTSFPVQVVVGVAAATTTMMNPSMSMTMASGAPPGNASIPSGVGVGTV